MAPKRKLTGAQARLFAEICEHYINAAEEECNDTPAGVPIFSWLSAHQRLRLVSEVMIGVLCEKEPLPPNTIQHNATFRALVEILFTQLEVESDTQYEGDDVGEDILRFDTPDPGNRRRTDEEIEEYQHNLDLIEHRAVKNMNKMKKKGKKGKVVGEFHVKESDNNPPNETHAQEVCDGLMKDLFSGRPISPEERNSIRPLTDDENYAFRWRRLCDAAFQEDFTFPFPLSAVDFDWRCQKLSKWYRAINLLLDTHIMDYRTPTDRALIMGEVNAQAYADPDQLPRIQAIEKHVEVLRTIYESTWDPMEMALDQRCIFAVCSDERYCGYGHQSWLNGFVANCAANGVEFTEGGNYQARLDIFRKMKPDFIEGLEYPYGCFHAEHLQENWIPSNFSPHTLFEGVHCHGPGKSSPLGFCFKRKNLQQCSRCGVAMYCSAECQHLHWPKHKKNCKQLRAERRNKEKIAELAKR